MLVNTNPHPKGSLKMNTTPTIIPFNTVLAADNGIDRDFDPNRARQERRRLLQSYPHSVILALHYPQLDIAEYWCWQQFGAAWGECLQRHADRPACAETLPHCHTAQRWHSHWYVKTGYDYGYNEFFFAHRADCERFLAFVPQIGAPEFL